MTMYQVIFSPTGGTQKAAELLTAAWSDVQTVDLTERTKEFGQLTFQEDDVCLVAVPSYGGRVPGTAVERLKQLNGNGARAVLACVYGNRDYEDTLLELEDILSERGFRSVAAVAAVAEHSIMPQFGSGRPDAQDKAELTDFAQRIEACLAEAAADEVVQVPGSRPYREYGGVPMQPKADKSCTRCGLCAAKCPTGAIDAQNPQETDSHECISCMRCLAICPQKARKLNKVVVSVAAGKMKKACSSRKSNALFV